MLRRMPVLAFFLVFALTANACVGTLLPTDTPAAPPTPEARATVTPRPTAGPAVNAGGQTTNGAPTASTRPQAGIAGLPDVASVVERVAPGVVSVIAAIESRDIFGRPFTSQSQGSGVVFHADGYILTNNHVVENAREVTVVFLNGENVEATIVGTDPATDLAVLKINPRDVRNLVVVPLGDTEVMRPGDWVIAIGNPLGFEGTVTVGVISAKERSLDVGSEQLYDLVQTDAVINPGNSGGPLLNLNGEVIGINTAIIRGQLRGGQEAEGIGFAIGMSTAIPVSAQIIANGRVIRPQIGVFLNNVTPVLANERGLTVDRGVLVVDLVAGGGAASAGVQAGDVITEVNGVEVVKFTDLQRLLITDYKVGDTVKVTVVRNGQRLELDVTLQGD